MTFNRGDVVLVHFPFSSGRGAKVRPAVVVQNDSNNRRLTNVIFAAITTTTHRRAEPTQLFIDISTPDGQQSGLLRNSVVTAENLATVATSLVQRRIGQLSPSYLAALDGCLKASLALP